jgi:hypothetical protein
VLFFLHSILTDPSLKDGHSDLLGGGKVFVESASFLSFISINIRYRLRGKELRQEPPERTSKPLSPESHNCNQKVTYRSKVAADRNKLTYHFTAAPRCWPETRRREIRALWSLLRDSLLNRAR